MGSGSLETRQGRSWSRSRARLGAAALGGSWDPSAMGRRRTARRWPQVYGLRFQAILTCGDAVTGRMSALRLADGPQQVHDLIGDRRRDHHVAGGHRDHAEAISTPGPLTPLSLLLRWWRGRRRSCRWTPRRRHRRGLAPLGVCWECGRGRTRISPNRPRRHRVTRRSSAGAARG